jgi:hypothetical protein
MIVSPGDLAYSNDSDSFNHGASCTPIVHCVMPISDFCRKNGPFPGSLETNDDVEWRETKPGCRLERAKRRKIFIFLSLMAVRFGFIGITTIPSITLKLTIPTTCDDYE